jgi:membrane associated rhomboid family serine protease
MLGSWTILVATSVVSLLGLFGPTDIIDKAILRPYWLRRKSQYMTLVTSGFVHADLWHLLFNMVTFYAFAFTLERRIGTASFLTLYFTGLLVSNLGTYFKHRANYAYASLGASGAILAVLFASIVYFPANRIFILPLPVPIPAPLFAVGYLIYSYYQARHSSGRINHDAHFSGALTGLAFALLMHTAFIDKVASIGGG